MKVLILMGLPASGKTTFAKDLVRASYSEIKYIDFDEILQHYKDKAINELSNLSYRNKTFIIDGLIHTNEQLSKVITALIENKKLEEIEVHYWKENREQCLINDTNRRTLSSKTSIKHLVLDTPDLTELKLLFENTSIKLHEVAIKPDWVIFGDKHHLGISFNQPYLQSDEWSTGGSYGNCWNDSIDVYEADEPLTEFKEFDDLLTTICPDISFLTYKKLKQISCSLGERHEKDYYGGNGSNYAYHKCNIEVLYNELVKLELIKPKIS